MAAPITSMLKITSAAGTTNPEQGGHGIQMEDQGEKEPEQKSRKGQKGQKTAKSKKWICAKKSKTSQAKNLSSQSGLLLIADARRTFTKLRQVFVKASILNHFDPERHIRIETYVSGYAIVEFLVS